MKRKAEQLFCEVCEKDFPYRSKYERHLVSLNHKRFAQSLAKTNILAEPPSHDEYDVDPHSFSPCTSSDLMPLSPEPEYWEVEEVRVLSILPYEANNTCAYCCIKTYDSVEIDDSSSEMSEPDYNGNFIKGQCFTLK